MMQKDKNYYNDFFEKYGASAHFQPERFLFVAGLLTGRVLDIGCGSGHLADYYTGNYTGVDISEKGIEIAKNIRRKDADFGIMDFTEKQQFLCPRFDSFYLGEFLEHIEKDEVVFENIIGSASDGARVVCSVPNGGRVPDESHCRIFSVPQIRRDYKKYGFVQFHDWPGFKERIVFSILLGVKAQNDMSLFMIVKDEEKGIEKAITSALHLVDKVIVSVDSLTTDKTREIAALYADELREHVWADDFSKARNEAAENVETKWILFLDGHEYIEKIGRVREKMREDVDGILVSIKLENGMMIKFPRIYRSYLKFENRVHNKLTCKKELIEPKFLIIHDRLQNQDSESMKRRFKQRDEMLPRVMKEMIAKNKKDTRSLFHLGNYYMMKKEWKLAAGYFKQYLKYGTIKQEIYLVLINRGLCLQMQGKLIRALWAFHRAERCLPQRWETARLVGGNLYAMERYKPALIELTRSIFDNSKDYLYHPFPKNLMEIWDLIANCYIKLKQWPEAATALDRAIDHAETEELKKYLGAKRKFVRMVVNEGTAEQKK